VDRERRLQRSLGDISAEIDATRKERNELKAQLTDSLFRTKQSEIRIEEFKEQIEQVSHSIG